MTRLKKTRNRAIKPTWTHSGITSDIWRSDAGHLTWAQTTPLFNELVSVLINERDRETLPVPGTTENYAYGLQVGYARALALVRSLAIGLTPPESAPPKADYSSDNDTLGDIPLDH